MRGLEGAETETYWRTKRALLQQYVLAYGYTCSNATLIMQSCLPCQLTGLLVQKLDFAPADTGSKTQKREMPGSRCHQHRLDAVQQQWEEKKQGGEEEKGKKRKKKRKHFLKNLLIQKTSGKTRKGCKKYAVDRNIHPCI